MFTHETLDSYCNSNFICPHYNKASDGGRTFSARTIKNWDNLDIIHTKSGTIKHFKKTFDKHYLDTQKVNCYFNDTK